MSNFTRRKFLQVAGGAAAVSTLGFPAIVGAASKKVVVIGGGVVGTQAARMAAGLGANVEILDRSLPRIRELDDMFQGRVTTRYSNAGTIENAITDADVVVGAVLIGGMTWLNVAGVRNSMAVIYAFTIMKLLPLSLLILFCLAGSFATALLFFISQGQYLVAIALFIIGNIGFSGGRFLLQAPLSDLQARRDAVMNALRNLIGTTQASFGSSEWPRGLRAYRQFLDRLSSNAHHDIRSLFQENELARVMDELIDRVAGTTADGLRALGATAQISLERFRRLIALGQGVVQPASPPFT